MGTYDVAVNQIRIRYEKAPLREMNREAALFRK